MYDSAVLDVAAGANADFVNIATNDNQRPHRAVRAYFHISDHDGGGIDESGGVNAGRLVLKNTHCHGKHLCRDEFVAGKFPAACSSITADQLSALPGG